MFFLENFGRGNGDRALLGKKIRCATCGRRRLESASDRGRGIFVGGGRFFEVIGDEVVV